MTFEELLKECANGKMPKVIYNGKICQVVTIKNGDGYYGVGVNIGNKWVDWFHAEIGTDKRKKYMSELTIASGITQDNSCPSCKNGIVIKKLRYRECDNCGTLF